MAKIRLTIMTENDKHIDERYSDEEIVAIAKKSWEYMLNALREPFGTDKAIIEKCELVER